MCGIVFVGANVMGTRDVERFEQMLYMDVVRGEHSTGVFAGFRLDKDNFAVQIEKAAIASDEYLRSAYWKRVKEMRKPHATIQNSWSVTQPKFLVGHNRYATAGAINDRNAHPFNHEHITLVHNGTLDDQSLLPDHKKFAVDSENICYSIAKQGFEETLKNLNGKFTLVWHDAKEQTLNFIRNKDRPFHLVETTTGDWFGASEEDMIMWLFKRKSFGPTIKRHFEMEVGVQYVFDVSSGFKFKEERKHELPTFRRHYPVYSGYNRNWYNDYDDDYDYDYGRGTRQPNASQSSYSGNRSTSQTSTQTDKESKEAQLNRILEAHGVKAEVGDFIHFESFQFDPYPKNKDKGKLTGYCGSAEYIEVQAHGFNTEDYVEGGEYRGKIISAYEMNYILHIIVAPATPIHTVNQQQTVTVADLVNRMANGEEIDDDMPPDDILDSTTIDLVEVRGDAFPKNEPETLVSEANKPQSYSPVTLRTSPPDENNSDIYGQDEEEQEQGNCLEIAASGELYTKKEWESNGALNTCANCGSPISFDEVETTVIRQGFAWCEGCAGDVDEMGYPKDSGSERPVYLFPCSVCGGEFHEDLMSEQDNMCVHCFKTHYVRAPEPANNILVYRKKLQNGMSVTKPLWEKMCNCNWCNKPIPWSIAENAEFVGARVTCVECSMKLEVGVIPYPASNT